MKRRDFIKLGLGTVAAASLTGCSLKAQSSIADQDAAFELGGPSSAMPVAILPRRCESLDFDWRFLPLPVASSLHDLVKIQKWHWKRGTPADAQQMTAPDINMSGDGWHEATTENAQMNFVGDAWFRTVLPPLDHSHRTVRFTHVDDNGVIYLNGVRLMRHQGWEDSFDVPLDSAWSDTGPNVLAVLVNNTSGPGGIYGPVSFGWSTGSDTYAGPKVDDATWQRVQLPHDYIVEGTYSAKADTGHGSLPVFPAWYRRQLHISAEDKGKSLFLYFEGVYRNAQVYMNGQLISRHPGGYTSFHVDISYAVHYGADNTLAVYVDPRDFEGWWYEGGGIYRHVWLNVVDKVHVAPWGAYVTSHVKNVTSNPSANLTIETTIANRHVQARTCTLRSTVMDADGKIVGSQSSKMVVESTLASIPDNPTDTILNSDSIDQPSYLHAGTKIVQQMMLNSVNLWSLENRYRYQLLSEVLVDGEVVDRHVQKFGIRTIRFNAQDGFFLNDMPVKLQGVCNHQDFAGVGIGIPDSLFYYRMKQLKEKLGCNAIRCSHNPMSPAMYEACDDLGLLVMDENRHPGSTVATKSWVGQPYSNTWHLENMVLRDRNHPSVIMWSMWNEEWGIQNDVYGHKMAKALMQAIHKHDTTRPISCANNSGTGNGWMIGVGSAEDLLGVNYNYQDYDWLHKQFPDKPIFGSETGSNCECRGIYHTDNVTAHLTSYMSPEGAWRPLGRRKFVAGGFVWTGFDYRGETNPFGWPEINSNFGLLDMCGFPKDDAFYYKAWWDRQTPMVHIFPHWNWPGKEGKNIPVWCFSNCDQVELFLNGKSLGRQTMPEFGHLQWNKIAYQPGKLEAHGYRNGRLESRTVVETTGAPAALRVSTGRKQLIADGQDTAAVAVEVVDGLGRVVPTAGNKVHFSVSGPGRNAGVGNGDPSCHEPNQATFRSSFAGLCMVLVQAGRSKGNILLTAKSDGLVPAQLVLPVISGL